MLNVMIVDDEERIRLGIEKILSRYEEIFESQVRTPTVRTRCSAY